MSRGYFFMMLLALQYGWQPLLTKECIDPEVQRTSVVIVQEVSKFAIAFVMLYSEGGKAAWNKALNEANAGKPWTFRSSLEIAGFPSCLYAVQNWLLFYSAANMDPLSFNLVNQTKLIWTAVFVYMILNRKQSQMQMVAIGMMTVAAILLSRKSGNEADTSEKNWDHEFWHGILPNLGAALISGFAAALSQRALQGVNRNSYLFTMELCVFQAFVLLLVQGGSAFTVSEGASFFMGWQWYTPLPIINNAMGGIFTGQVVISANVIYGRYPYKAPQK